MEIVSATPTVAGNLKDNYVNPKATIFMTVGTAGAKQHGLYRSSAIYRSFYRVSNVNLILTGIEAMNEFITPIQASEESVERELWSVTFHRSIVTYGL